MHFYDVNMLLPEQLAELEKNVYALKEICSLEVYKSSNLASGPHDEIYANYLQNLASFRMHARTLRKTPSEKLYHEYLFELALKHSSPVTTITTREKKRVEARKTWSDFVSSVYTENQNTIQQHDIKTLVAQRLDNMGVHDIDKTYDDCLTYLRDRSVITVTFNASIFFHNGLNDAQLLNIHESLKKETDPEYHKKLRYYCEEYYASRYLKEPLKTSFLANLHSRMRYGAIKFLDTRIEPLHPYGRSFIVLKDVVKLNSVFVPGDSLEVGATELCTIHNMELLLLLTKDNILRNILAHIDADHPVNDRDCVKDYIEVMLPGVDILDSNLVEHIYIDSTEYMLTQDEIRAFQHLGILITNIENPKHEPQIKSAKVVAIKAALECIEYQHNHLSDARCQIRDVALSSIKEQIRTIKDVIAILPYLSTAPRAILLDILLDDLPSWIQSGRDFGLILYYLTGEGRSAFADSMLHQLPDVIQSGFDFDLANEYLSEIQRSIFQKAMLPRLQSIIRSGKDLRAVLKYLAEDQAKELLLTMQADLPSLFQSSQDFAEELHFLSKEMLAFIFVKGLQKKLPLFITSASNLEQTLLDFTWHKDRELFIDTMMAEFPRLITLFNDFERIYRRIGEGHSLEFIHLMAAKLPTLLTSSEQGYQCLQRLSGERQQAFFNAIKNKLSELIISPEALIQIASELKEDQYQEFYNLINENYPKLIPSLNVFGQVLAKIDKRARQSFVDSIIEQLPSLIPPGRTFISMLNELDEGAVVVDAMFQKHPYFLAPSGNLHEIMCLLYTQSCERVLFVMRPQLPMIFKGQEHLLIRASYPLNDRHPLNILHYLFLNHSLETANRFYHALLNKNHESIKKNLDTLIESTKYKDRPLRFFVNQASIDQLMEQLANINIEWLKTINLALNLRISADELENKAIVVLGLENYTKGIKGVRTYDFGC